MQLSEKLKLIRFVKNLNKKQFAELTGVAQSTITRYESGDREPDYSFLKILFEKLDVNPNWIFLDEEPMIRTSNSKEDKVAFIKRLITILEENLKYSKDSNELLKSLLDKDLNKKNKL